jgi:hypothetical protein
LARALFRHTELGDEIPEALFTAVAEVLAYVLQLKAHREHGGLRPAAPTELDAPPQMDPNNPASSSPGVVKMLKRRVKSYLTRNFGEYNHSFSRVVSR